MRNEAIWEMEVAVGSEAVTCICECRWVLLRYVPLQLAPAAHHRLWHIEFTHVLVHAFHAKSLSQSPTLSTFMPELQFKYAHLRNTYSLGKSDCDSSQIQHSSEFHPSPHGKTVWSPPNHRSLHFYCVISMMHPCAISPQINVFLQLIPVESHYAGGKMFHDILFQALELVLGRLR